LDLAAYRLPQVRRAAAVTATLTPREVAVLTLVGAGQSNAEIGRSLHLAESSVKSHIGHLLGKLGLADRVHLVIFAYDNGLAAPTSDRDSTEPIRPGRLPHTELTDGDALGADDTAPRSGARRERTG
jgi:DNA-binding CsgD family transcriptional regulator